MKARDQFATRLQASAPAGKIADPWPLSKLMRETEPVPLSFYERPPEEAAPALLGCVVLHGSTAGMIVETEAYLGLDDLAAHASRGKTKRNQVLFGPAGRAYVYLIYGMYECLNFVAKKDEGAGCVLIRALQPLSGLKEMYRHRDWHGPVAGLANGPGKLTLALGITRQHYGARLDRGDLTVRRWRKPPNVEVAITPRIGISKCAELPLRFVWRGNLCVSKPYSYKVEAR